MSEIEAKYPISDYAEAEKILSGKTGEGTLSYLGTVRMRSEYFDTSEFDLRRQNGGFRLRYENGVPYCTLKFGRKSPDGYFNRQEYECRADSPEDGLKLLPGAGAPEKICGELLEKGLVKTAGMEFERKKYLYRRKGLEAEFALDLGRLFSSGGSAPICELEIELKEGTPEDFRTFLKKIEKEYALIPSGVSKYSAALMLSVKNHDTEENVPMEEKKAVNPFYVASELLNYCIREGYVEFSMDENKKIHYYVAKDQEEKLHEKFGIVFECSCAWEKPE